ncbi:MAG TPA: DNA polymerase III subunit delta [bacterium]|nr:DNA polymerase III subunit delta [bacterium]
MASAGSRRSAGAGRSSRPAAPEPGARPRPSRAGSPQVYLLLGDEDVRAEQALGRLLDDLLPASDRALNLDVMNAGETPVEEIMTRCETLPFFGARRVVVVRRGEEFRAQDQDALAAYLERGASPSAALIVIAESLDRRRRLFGVLQRVGRVILCGRLDPKDLPPWIRTRVKEEGKTITPDAAEVLVGLVGGGLRELGLEIAKLVAYVGERPTITPQDVHEAASHVAEATVFELMDAVGHRQADRALRVLQTVIALGEPPVRILYMLEDQLRMLLRTKALVERRPHPARISPDEIREVLGTRAWLFGRYREQVAAFGAMDVARVLGLLVETDAMIKTGATPARLAIETLIVRLCVE